MKTKRNTKTKQTKNPQFTVSIGIPAYNEEGNIGALLSSIVAQQLQTITLDEIIVVSDCSTDHTNQIVSSIQDPRVILLKNSKRLGQALSQNRILERVKSDALVLFNADTLPGSITTVEEIVAPIRQGADYCVPKAVPVAAENIFERVINYSVLLKTTIFEKMNGGDTMYLCGGRARVFSKSLYRRLRWPRLVTEDSYSFLYAKLHSYTTTYLPKSVVYFRSPATLTDHAKQSKRFRIGKEEMSQFFPHAFVSEWYRLPLPIVISTVMEQAIRRPVVLLSYLTIQLIVGMYGIGITPTWEVSKTSKRPLHV